MFKQKTAYEMRISDWSSDVCSSDRCARAGSPEIAIHFFPEPHFAGSHSPASQPIKRPSSRFLQTARASSPEDAPLQLGSASCRERVCQYVSISVFAVALNKKSTQSDRPIGIHVNTVKLHLAH